LFGKDTANYQESEAFLADSVTQCSNLDYDENAVGGEPDENENPVVEVIKGAEMLGIPAKYVYIGGGVAGFFLVCYLIRKLKE